MPDSLLTTKLLIPPVCAQRVQRTRLNDQLQASLNGRLTLVSAAAGFGKTSLLADWASHSSVPVAWLSLDEKDNDSTLFLTYLIAALQTVQPGVGQSMLGLLSTSQPQPLPLEAILTALVNAVSEIEYDFCVVLDDYHVLTAESVHQCVAFLIEHLPTHMHVILATRSDPPLHLARLRARRQLAELRTSDLRFTPQEAAEFLNQCMGLSLTLEGVVEIESRTEGWIAGLQLAALSLQHEANTAEFIQNFAGSHRHIVDYLVEEVLQRQPPVVQDFLLRTSVLENLCGPLCDVVVQDDSLSGDQLPASQTMLERLERENLFVTPLDHERRWYRYHALFADLLRARLLQSQGDRVAVLHRRAADWYERNGLTPSAISHAIQASDWDGVARLVESIAQSMVTSGEGTTVLSWLSYLPEAILAGHPHLSLAKAWALVVVGQVDAVESCLADLSPQASSTILSEAAALRALVASIRSDIPTTILQAEQALATLPVDHFLARGAVEFSLGAIYAKQGDSHAALPMLCLAVQHNQAAANAVSALVAQSVLAQTYEMQGQLQQAVDLYRSIAALVQDPVLGTLPLVGWGLVGLGSVLHSRYVLDDAEQALQQGLALGRRWGSAQIMINGYSGLFALNLSQRNLAGAADLVQQFEAEARLRQADFALSRIDACRAQLALLQGQVAQTTAWATGYQQRLQRVLDYRNNFENVILAQVLLAQHKLDEALNWLLQLSQNAQTNGRLGDLIELLVLQALVRQAQGNPALALTALEQALDLGEPEGYRRPFLDEGLALVELVRTMARRQPSREYVLDLRHRMDNSHGPALDDHQPETSPVKDPWLGIPLVADPLTERELEVLNLLAAGLSNQEIADRLVVALSTIKSHVKSIYGKLDVQSRTQALARGHELGLL